MSWGEGLRALGGHVDDVGKFLSRTAGWVFNGMSSADDLARGAGKVAGHADDVARGAGKVAGHADDVARGAGKVAGHADDVAKGTSRLGKLSRWGRNVAIGTTAVGLVGNALGLWGGSNTLNATMMGLTGGKGLGDLGSGNGSLAGGLNGMAGGIAAALGLGSLFGRGGGGGALLPQSMIGSGESEKGIGGGGPISNILLQILAELRKIFGVSVQTASTTDDIKKQEAGTTTILSEMADQTAVFEKKTKRQLDDMSDILLDADKQLKTANEEKIAMDSFSDDKEYHSGVLSALGKLPSLFDALMAPLLGVGAVALGSLYGHSHDADIPSIEAAAEKQIHDQTFTPVDTDKIKEETGMTTNPTTEAVVDALVTVGSMIGPTSAIAGSAAGGLAEGLGVEDPIARAAIDFGAGVLLRKNPVIAGTLGYAEVMLRGSSELGKHDDAVSVMDRDNQTSLDEEERKLFELRFKPDIEKLLELGDQGGAQILYDKWRQTLTQIRINSAMDLVPREHWKASDVKTEQERQDRVFNIPLVSRAVDIENIMDQHGWFKEEDRKRFFEERARILREEKEQAELERELTAIQEQATSENTTEFLSREEMMEAKALLKFAEADNWIKNVLNGQSIDKKVEYLERQHVRPDFIERYKKTGSVTFTPEERKLIKKAEMLNLGSKARFADAKPIVEEPTASVDDDFDYDLDWSIDIDKPEQKPTPSDQQDYTEEQPEEPSFLSQRFDGTGKRCSPRRVFEISIQWKRRRLDRQRIL